MKYSEVLFTCKGGPEWHRDLFMQELADIGFDTFEEHDNGFSAFIASAQLDIALLDSLILRQPDGFEVSYTHQEIAPQNWNAVWESNFEPVTIGEVCYVRATFHEPKPEFRYEIVIEPKMSFGTGHHQTTSLIMRYMLDTTFTAKRVLDMGCGTGILAILAIKLGAAGVLAVDNDPVCIDSVVENAQMNDAPDIEAKLGSAEVIDGMQFDTILANINRNILLDQLESYSRCLEKGGSLYMSGFYDGADLAALQAAGEKVALAYREHRVLDGWAAARFTKTN